MQLIDYGDLVRRLGNGGHTYFYVVLMIMVVLDILAGVSRAVIQKVINSSIGIDGLIRKTVILVLPLLLYPLFDVIGAGVVYSGIVTGFIAFEGSSLILNLKAIGLPIPDSFVNFFDNKELSEKSTVNETLQK